MRSISVLLLLAAIGCHKNPTFTIGGQKLEVQSQYYYYTALYFCDQLAQKQIDLRMVDYPQTCSDPMDDAGNVSTQARVELHFIFGTLDHNPQQRPYQVGPIDCVNGGTNTPEATAYGLAYGAGSTMPTRIE